MKTYKLIGAALATASLLILAGCGGGGSTSAAPATTNAVGTVAVITTQ